MSFRLRLLKSNCSSSSWAAFACVGAPWSIIVKFVRYLRDSKEALSSTQLRPQKPQTLKAMGFPSSCTKAYEQSASYAVTKPGWI